MCGSWGLECDMLSLFCDFEKYWINYSLNTLFYFRRIANDSDNDRFDKYIMMSMMRIVLTTMG